MDIIRRRTRVVDIGNVKVGSGHPVSIQSMTKTRTSDAEATIGQILSLESSGCEIIRVAVKSQDDAEAIRYIKEKINIPLVADIHFDHRLALACIKNGVDKIRINPGNITASEHIAEVIVSAKQHGVPIRVGVNSGSIPDDIRDKIDMASRMVFFTMTYLENFRRSGFDDIVLSLKAADVTTTVDAYRKISEKCDYPLHLGVTAAGAASDGVVRSSIGIGALLLDGIGDTIRVSLTGDPHEEVHTAKRILSSLGLRNFGPEVIACPTCGRCQVDLVGIVEELKDAISSNGLDRSAPPLTVAVMGCEVNGPGEAKAADIGVAFGSNKGVLFKKGAVLGTVEKRDAVKKLMDLIIKETTSGD